MTTRLTLSFPISTLFVDGQWYWKFDFENSAHGPFNTEEGAVTNARGKANYREV